MRRRCILPTPTANNTINTKKKNVFSARNCFSITTPFTNNANNRLLLSTTTTSGVFFQCRYYQTGFDKSFSRSYSYTNSSANAADGEEGVGRRTTASAHGGGAATATATSKSTTSSSSSNAHNRGTVSSSKRSFFMSASTSVNAGASANFRSDVSLSAIRAKALGVIIEHLPTPWVYATTRMATMRRTAVTRNRQSAATGTTATPLKLLALIAAVTIAYFTYAYMAALWRKVLSPLLTKDPLVRRRLKISTKEPSV